MATDKNKKESPQGRTVKKKKKRNEYWTEEAEVAVKELLEMDTRYLTLKMKKYLDSREKTYDDTIEDGTLAEMMEKIEWSETAEVHDMRNRLYKEKLEEPLNILVENIIYSFRLFRYDIDVRTAHNDCLGHIHEKFVNFDPYAISKKTGEPTRAFSYFGTVAKNYCMNAIKNLNDSKPIHLDYEEYKPEVETTRIKSGSGSAGEMDDTRFELFNHITELLEDEIDKEKWTKNDIRVAEAIVYILKEHAEIKVYNKVDIYKEIRERTGLERKDITYSLGRIRVFYRLKKENFIKKKNNL